MLIVQKGWVTHNGVTYGRGQALPEMKRVDELRLLDLKTCYEGDVPKLVPIGKEETSPPIENEEEGKSLASSADIDLNFDPDENIKPKSKGTA